MCAIARPAAAAPPHLAPVGSVSPVTWGHGGARALWGGAEDAPAQQKRWQQLILPRGDQSCPFGSHPVPQGPALPRWVPSCPFRSHPVPQGPVLTRWVPSCDTKSYPILLSPILSHQVPRSPTGSEAALEGPILLRGAAGAGGGSRRQDRGGDGHSPRAKRRSHELKIPTTEVEVSAPAARGWGGPCSGVPAPAGDPHPQHRDPTKVGGSTGRGVPVTLSWAPRNRGQEERHRPPRRGGSHPARAPTATAGPRETQSDK